MLGTLVSDNSQFPCSVGLKTRYFEKKKGRYIETFPPYQAFIAASTELSLCNMFSYAVSKFWALRGFLGFSLSPYFSYFPLSSLSIW